MLNHNDRRTGTHWQYVATQAMRTRSSEQADHRHVVDAAKYTLGDSVKLYVAAIKKLELQNVELKGFFDNYAPRATEYRNNLVHGILRDPVGGQSWKGLLDFLAEFLPVNRRFVELIKGHGNVEKGATS